MSKNPPLTFEDGSQYFPCTFANLAKSTCSDALALYPKLDLFNQAALINRATTKSDYRYVSAAKPR